MLRLEMKFTSIWRKLLAREFAVNVNFLRFLSENPAENNYFHPFTAFNSRSFEKFQGLPKLENGAFPLKLRNKELKAQNANC